MRCNMDQQSIYGINDLSGFQPGPSQVDNDISMSVDPEGQLPPEFDGLSMDIGANSLIDGVQKSYTPLNTGTSHRTIAASTSAVSIPLSGDVPASLPADFAAQSAGPVPSTQAEFKKRKNIEPQIVEELEDFLHILTPDGRIVYLSPSGKDLTGYPQDELLGKFILDFIHPDDSGIFMRDFNESITSGKPIQLFYRFRKRDGTYTIFECRGHPQFSSDAAAFRLNNAAGVCEGYFMMARPYPTKNAALLDSFLEQKIEHERLTKRINDLKREEAEDAEEEQRQWQRKQGRRSDMPHEDINTIGGTSATIPTSPRLLSPNAKVMLLPTPSMPIHSGATRSNAEDGAANRHPDSIDGNVARYDDVTHVETIEMFTGLRYQDGERSRGISTGDQSPTLVRGDAGIAIPINKEQKGTDKKKKIKLPEEYVCTDCGTLDSPEWRKGPSGPKTLCNACGLRWAKKEKRKSFSAPVPLMVYSGPK